MNKRVSVALIVAALLLLAFGSSFAGEIRLGQFAALMNQDGSNPLGMNGEWILTDGPGEFYAHPLNENFDLRTQCSQANPSSSERPKWIDSRINLADTGTVKGSEIPEMAAMRLMAEQFDDPLVPLRNDLDDTLIEQRAISEVESTLNPPVLLDPLPVSISGYISGASAVILLAICALALVFNRRQPIRGLQN